MKKVLLVDDDALILKLYQDGLTRRGYRVETVAHGLAAVHSLRLTRPDVIVLDLMMPKLSGVDVLKFIRSQAGLSALPVVVLSNVYLSELAEQAVAIGVQKALLKTRCSPPILADILNDLLATQSANAAPSPSTAAPLKTDATAPPQTSNPGPTSTPSPAAGIAEPVRATEKPISTESFTKARLNFLEQAPLTCAAIRTLCQGFSNAPDPVARAAWLTDLYRKVRFLTDTAGFAQLQTITLLARAFEALLFELREKPSFITPSVLRTLANTVDFLSELCERAGSDADDPPFSAHVLVVDDDPLSTRLLVAALLRAHLPAHSTESPEEALRMLQEKNYDLVLLDVVMPGMDGFELCKRMRALPGYQKTPVVYVTAHFDFEYRAKSVLSGGNDLIAKPVFPLELAVKAVTHLIKSRLSEQGPDR